MGSRCLIIFRGWPSKRFFVPPATRRSCGSVRDLRRPCRLWNAVESIGHGANQLDDAFAARR
jgi:hypothetical protein